MDKLHPLSTQQFPVMGRKALEPRSWALTSSFANDWATNTRSLNPVNYVHWIHTPFPFDRTIWNRLGFTLLKMVKDEDSRFPVPYFSLHPELNFVDDPNDLTPESKVNALVEKMKRSYYMLHFAAARAIQLAQILRGNGTAFTRRAKSRLKWNIINSIMSLYSQLPINPGLVDYLIEISRPVVTNEANGNRGISFALFMDPHDTQVDVPYRAGTKPQTLHSGFKRFPTLTELKSLGYYATAGDLPSGESEGYGHDIGLFLSWLKHGLDNALREVVAFAPTLRDVNSQLYVLMQQYLGCTGRLSFPEISEKVKVTTPFAQDDYIQKMMMYTSKFSPQYHISGFNSLSARTEETYVNTAGQTVDVRNWSLTNVTDTYLETDDHINPIAIQATARRDLVNHTWLGFDDGYFSYGIEDTSKIASFLLTGDIQAQYEYESTTDGLSIWSPTTAWTEQLDGGVYSNVYGVKYFKFQFEMLKSPSQVLYAYDPDAEAVDFFDFQADGKPTIFMCYDEAVVGSVTIRQTFRPPVNFLDPFQCGFFALLDADDTSDMWKTQAAHAGYIRSFDAMDTKNFVLDENGLVKHKNALVFVGDAVGLSPIKTAHRPNTSMFRDSILRVAIDGLAMVPTKSYLFDTETEMWTVKKFTNYAISTTPGTLEPSVTPTEDLNANLEPMGDLAFLHRFSSRRVFGTTFRVMGIMETLFTIGTQAGDITQPFSTPNISAIGVAPALVSEDIQSILDIKVARFGGSKSTNFSTKDIPNAQGKYNRTGNSKTSGKQTSRSDSWKKRGEGKTGGKFSKDSRDKAWLTDPKTVAGPTPLSEGVGVNKHPDPESMIERPILKDR